MKTKAEIKIFFDDELLADLQEFDKQHSKAYKGAVLGFIVIFSGIIFGIIWLFISNDVILLLFLLGLISFVSKNISNKVSIEYRKIYCSYKSRIIPRMLDEIFENVNYIPLQHISEKAISESNIFSELFSYDSGEDYFKCEVKGIVFQFSEISVSYVDVEKLKFNTYSGIFGISEFNKNFKTRTIIIPKSKMPLLKSKFLKMTGIGNDFSKINLEDPVFNDEFEVYGQDQIESRYILTPSFMENVLNYRKTINSRLAFSFAQDRLNVFIFNSKDLFEPPFYGSYSDFEHFYKNINYFILFASIVEELNLNVKIWGRD